MVTYRTAGSWGAGKGANLTPTEVDENFNELDTRIDAIEANPPTAIYLVYFEIRDGNQLYGIMSDLSEIGPITVPDYSWQYKDAWQTGFSYKPLDFFTRPEGVYLVVYPHVSSGTFDPDANDGLGNNYYQLILPPPPVALWRGEWEAVEDYAYLDTFKVSTPLEYAGVYQTNIAHTSGSEFDPDETSLPSGGEPLYTKMFDFPLKRLEIAPYFFVPHNDGAVLYEFIASRSFLLPVGLDGSQAKANAAATGTAEWTLTKNGSPIGLVVFDGSDTGTFTFPHAVQFDAGDILGFTAPSPADLTLGNVALNLVGGYI